MLEHQPTSLCTVLLTSARVGDPRLREVIARLPAPSLHLSLLRSLVIDSDRITDAGLKHLVQLRKLHRLELGQARIAAASVHSLAQLTNLRELVLRGTSLPKPDLETLRGRLPLCRIENR